MPCEYCCEKDSNDNWIEPPCCDRSGFCDAGDCNPENSSIGMCICCGGEMFKERGSWFHHTQREIPFFKRGTTHFGS